jgi:menaquinone-9 beta-reductase
LALRSDAIFDLAIIGAGPAGSAAAITGAKLGLRVLQLEAGTLPRHKVCGEFISPEAITLLRSLLSDEDLSMLNSAPRISRVCLHVDGRHAELPLKAAGISLSRSGLDQALWRSAQKHGVNCVEKCRVKAVLRDGDLFQLSAENREFCARAVVNCSGRWSELSLPFEESKARDTKWIGIKGHFYEANPTASCDLYFFSEGYCGVLPVTSGGDGKVNAAAVVRSELARTFEELFRLHPALQQRASGWQPVFSQVTTAPLIFRQPQTCHGGVLLAGDAAGFIDPFTGDGISLAIHSGSKAASMMLGYVKRNLGLEEATEAYDGWYRKNFLSAFSSAKRLRSLLTMPRVVRHVSMSLLKMPLIGSIAVEMTRAKSSFLKEVC